MIVFWRQVQPKSANKKCHTPEGHNMDFGKIGPSKRKWTDLGFTIMAFQVPICSISWGGNWLTWFPMYSLYMLLGTISFYIMFGPHYCFPANNWLSYVKMPKFPSLSPTKSIEFSIGFPCFSTILTRRVCRNLTQFTVIGLRFCVANLSLLKKRNSRGWCAETLGRQVYLGWADNSCGTSHRWCILATMVFGTMVFMHCCWIKPMKYIYMYRSCLGYMKNITSWNTLIHNYVHYSSMWDAHQKIFSCYTTLPKTNIAPENRPSQ